jgi:membrane protease YdiL (CAAX protease family)
MNILIELPLFPVKDHLSIIFTFNIPFLILLRYMLIDAEFKRGFYRTDGRIRLPSLSARVRGFIIPSLFTLTGLFAIALSLTFLSFKAGYAQKAPFLAAPRTLLDFFVLILSCLSTAYLEEGFFRFYFLEKCAALGKNIAFAAALSALCFAAFHLWEGFWGTCNALCAGIFLSAVYLKTKSLHVIALAHTAYDIFVYTAG